MWIQVLKCKELKLNFIQMNIKDNPLYVGDIIPSIATYEKVINTYKKGLKSGDFYEEPIGDDFNYPDW